MEVTVLCNLTSVVTSINFQHPFKEEGGQMTQRHRYRYHKAEIIRTILEIASKRWQTQFHRSGGVVLWKRWMMKKSETDDVCKRQIGEGI